MKIGTERLKNGNLLVHLPVALRCQGGRRRIVPLDGDEPAQETSLATMLARAWSWQRAIDEGCYANGKELVFVCPAKDEDALLIENKAKNGTTYLRVDDLGPLDVSNMNNSGEMTTEIELGKVIRCEIIPEEMKHDINLNFSKKAYGFLENTEDGKTVLDILNRLYEGKKE